MKKQVISFHYELKDDEGVVLDSSKGADPLTVMQGAGQIIPGLEKELAGMKTGEKKMVVVAPAEAYGEYDQRFVITADRDKLPKSQMNVGDLFEVGPSKEESQVVKVVEITDTQVTLDGNHPLAGKTLHFDVEITSVRDATEEELAHGHAHGAGGHHHH